MKSINVILERNEDAFFAYIPEIPGCTAGGWDEEDVKQNIRKMLEICIEEDPHLRRRLSNEFVLKFAAKFES